MEIDRLPLNIWRRFVQEGTLDPGRIDRVIRESWMRSKENRVNPYKEKGEILLSKGELFAKREEVAWLMREAETFIRKVKKLLSSHRMILLLTDEEGYILLEEGHPATLDQAKKICFLPGARWSEKDVGTNAIGTAIVTKQPVYIEGYQHYTVATHSWCCAAAPIRNKSGRILCVLNVSGPLEFAHPYLLPIVSTLTMSLEDRIRQLETPTTAGFQGIVGQSKVFQTVLEMARRAATVSSGLSDRGKWNGERTGGSLHP